MRVEDVYEAYNALKMGMGSIWEAESDRDLVINVAYGEGALEMARLIVEIIRKEEPAEEPEQAKKKEKAKRKSTPKKVELDMGRVRALHQGGWTQAAIADDVGVSVATICKVLKKIEAENHED